MANPLINSGDAVLVVYNLIMLPVSLVKSIFKRSLGKCMMS